MSTKSIHLRSDNKECQSRPSSIIANALFERVVHHRILPSGCVVCCDMSNDVLIRNEIRRLVRDTISGWERNCKQIFFRNGISKDSILDDILLKLFLTPEKFLVLHQDGTADPEMTFSRIAISIQNLLRDEYRKVTINNNDVENENDIVVAKPCVKRFTELNQECDLPENRPVYSDDDIQAFRRFVSDVLASNPELQSIFEMRLYQQLEPKEIGRLIGKTDAYINKKYFTAKRQIKKFVECHPEIVKQYF